MNATTMALQHSLEKFAKEAGLRLWRTVLVVLVVCSAIYVGVTIPRLLSGIIGELKPAGLVFGAATVLAVLRDLLRTLPKALDYIVSAVTNSLPKLFAETAVATLGVGFAWFAAVEGAQFDHPINLSVRGSLPPLILNESGSIFATYLIFDNWSSALPADDKQRAFIDNLVVSLAECIQSSSDTVDILVRGYASSFGTDKANANLYKARGTFVVDLLQNRIQELAPDKAAQFKVDKYEWKSLEMMKIRRVFKDTDDNGVYLQKAGALNRRADVLVRSAGNCLSG